jgi:hypothetical protein
LQKTANALQPVFAEYTGGKLHLPLFQPLSVALKEVAIGGLRTATASNT